MISKKGHTVTKSGKHIKNPDLRLKISSILNNKNERSNAPVVISLKEIKKKLKRRYGLVIQSERLRRFLQDHIVHGPKYRGKFGAKVTRGTEMLYYLEDRYEKKI